MKKPQIKINALDSNNVMVWYEDKVKGAVVVDLEKQESGRWTASFRGRKMGGIQYKTDAIGQAKFWLRKAMEE